jgi:catalase
MQMQQPKGRVAYEPNSLSADAARQTPQGFRSASVRGGGDKTRQRPESFADHYSQARQFFISQTALEQAHIASALVFELSKVEHLHIRQAMVGHLRHIDGDLAHRVCDGLGLPELPAAPRVGAPVLSLPPSPALGLADKARPSLKGRTVGVLVGDGSDGAITSEGAVCKLIARKVGGVRLADGGALAADAQLAGAPSVLFDAVALVLSETAASAMVNDSAAIDFVRDAFGHLKALGYDDGAEGLLQAAGIDLDDAAVVPLSKLGRFTDAAGTRQWSREPAVRMLA